MSSFSSKLHGALINPLYKGILEFRRRGGGSFDPTSLFDGEEGLIYDFLSASTLSQDIGGTVPVSDTDPVWRVSDLSPNGNNALATASGTRPIYSAADGLQFDSSLLTVPLDLSGTDKITVVIGIRHKRNSTALALEFGTGASNGGFYLTSPESTDGVFAWRLYGSLGGNGGRNSLGSLIPQSTVRSCVFDMSASGYDQCLSYTGGGLDPTTVTSSAVGAFGALTLHIGSHIGGSLPILADISRIVIIGRALTDAERKSTEDWCGKWKTWGASVGDSVTAVYGSDPAVATLIDGYGGSIIAQSGDWIGNQLTAWNALPATYKSSYKSVFVAIGLNDVRQRHYDTSADIIADYQGLIDAIIADVSPSCKIYACTLTPAKEWFSIGYGTGNTEPAYQRWNDLNEAIQGGGLTPITGTYGYIDGPTASLNDGSGNLAALYDTNADGLHVHPNLLGRQIIADAWRARLQSDGLLP